MPHPLPILAANDDNVGKAIAFGIIAALWVLGHFANWVKKASSPPKIRPLIRPPSLPAGAHQPIPALKQALRSAPPLARPVGKAVPQARWQAQRRPAAFSARPVPPPLPRARIPQPPPPAPPPPAPVAPLLVAASAQTAQPAFAASINRWLQPNTLRKQFILTEIFQPPLVLREPDAHQSGR